MATALRSVTSKRFPHRQLFLRQQQALCRSQSRESSDGYRFRTVVAVGLAGAAGGLLLSSLDSHLKQRALPPSAGRLCCEVPLTDAQKELTQKLQGIVGKDHVAANVIETGTMVGSGQALAVVRPGSLEEAVEVLKACIAADVAVVPQGAKTGLTGGSVPRDAGCDRPNVVICMRRLDKIVPVGKDVKQVLCFAGAGIYSLQEKMKEFGRDSHSVLGSIFLNPSVAAGVSFGSGGTQIHKGPVYTDRALYCRISPKGEVELVDTLGLKKADGTSGADVLSFLQGKDALADEDMDPKCKRAASYPNYRKHVTTCDGKVSRYNADLAGEDCNRSEGKVLILATIHDTFPLPKDSKLFWISCKDFATADALKRKVALAAPDCLAKQCEYIERGQFDCIDKAGRVMIKMIEVLGMMNLGSLWNLKLQFEALPIPFADIICDKILWWLNPLLPESLPPAMMQQGRDFDHHVLMELTDFGNGELQRLEGLLKEFVAAAPDGKVKCHECADAHEKTRAILFRFAVQPAIRTTCVGMGLQGLLIDYAMPKNSSQLPEMPSDCGIQLRVSCSHFGCNVFHDGVMFGPEVNFEEAKRSVKKFIESKGGKLPAEHGHGTEYEAPADTQQRWKKIDPTNAMNPGVGHSSRLRHYGCSSCSSCKH
mmetsp:Transcript_80826/g.142549  ORF Transcript_80826/g.142549 Transcript_80826/m.142549 type:complete len:652 (+) Transcript_80826:30-1985(+)